jgi:hypothetical protein
MLLVLWEAWKAYAHRAAGYQSHVLLTLVYALVFGPGAMLGRLFGTRLLDLDPGPRSSWLLRSRPEKTLESLRRQF